MERQARAAPPTGRRSRRCARCTSLPGEPSRRTYIHPPQPRQLLTACRGTQPRPHANSGQSDARMDRCLKVKRRSAHLRAQTNARCVGVRERHDTRLRRGIWRESGAATSAHAACTAATRPVRCSAGDRPAGGRFYAAVRAGLRCAAPGTQQAGARCGLVCEMKPVVCDSVGGRPPASGYSQCPGRERRRRML